MNWDAIGAIAETLGAVGVIASLVYLATQIRHSREQMRENTRATRASAYQEFVGQLHSTMMSAGDNPQREQAVTLGMADFSQLSEEDAFRFILWVNGVTHAFENAHYQYRQGMLDEDRWQMHYADARQMFQKPGVVQWWRAAPPNVSPAFIALVDEILAEEPDRGE
jgi:hypothetical protein